MTTPSAIRAPRRSFAPIAIAAVLGLLVLSLIMGVLGRGSRATGPAQTSWHGTVAPGAWVRLRNTNGAITVAQANGPEVVINATRSSARGRRALPMRLLTERRGDDLTACVAPVGVDRCGANVRQPRNFFLRLLRGYGPTEMSFVVALPAGVRLDASTVNGGVTVADAAGEVVAHSVNGSVVIGAVGGPVRAETVNGQVTAQIASLAPGAEVKLGSVNGSVTALLPPSLDASLDLSTTNGHLTADFDGVTVPPRARTLRTTLGAGGDSRVSLHTVNGNVRAEPLP
jgi:hypothetical protein